MIAINRNDLIFTAFGALALLLSLMGFAGPLFIIMYVLTYMFPYLMGRFTVSRENMNRVTILLSLSYFAFAALIVLVVFMTS